jgi:uracil-DNA glycosylase
MFCKGNLLEQVIKVFNEDLFENQMDVSSYYINMINNYENELPYDIGNSLKIDNLNLTFNKLLSQKNGISNIGIDLPVFFENNLGNDNRIMIIAMDPKRNGQNNNQITLNSVFSIHSKRHGRETNKNDYWNFIEPLIKNNFIYITDVYKLYFESSFEENGKLRQKLSNKDPEFIGKHTDAYKKNKLFLEKEINFVKPNKIISLGNESATALKSIMNINTNELVFEQNKIEYLFMPHISRTVTQSIPTIANLFISLGNIKNNGNLSEIGKKIHELRKNLYN